MKQSPNPRERNWVQYQRKKMVPRLKLEQRIKGSEKMYDKVNIADQLTAHTTICKLPINIFCNDLSQIHTLRIKLRVIECLKKNLFYSVINISPQMQKYPMNTKNNLIIRFFLSFNS